MCVSEVCKVNFLAQFRIGHTETGTTLVPSHFKRENVIKVFTFYNVQRLAVAYKWSVLYSLW